MEILRADTICKLMIDMNILKMRKILLSVGEEVDKINDHDLDKACNTLEKLNAQIEVLQASSGYINLELME